MLKNKQINEKLFHGQSGKSLLEIIMVLLIVVVVATFAIAQYRSAHTQYERQNVARMLKVNMERARFDSVKRRSLDPAQQAKVIINQNWFSITTDANGNGTLDSSDTEVTNLTNNGVSITGQDMVFPVTLSFDNRGNVAEAKGSDGVNINPIFYVCNGNCTPSTLTAANSNIVLISPAGTVNLMSGNAVLPNFNNPLVTNVNGSTSVNCQVAVSTASCAGGSTPSSGTATPTPTSTVSQTPTITPTITPTVTPTASPTGTATPALSPTPTPTPVACTANQKPSQTGCWCTPPMQVKTNGKCN